MLGARTTKPTELVNFLVDMSGFPEQCDHPKKSWTIPWSGKCYESPRPYLRGKQWAIPSEEWKANMLLPWEPSGPYITQGSATYPGRMNLQLAVTLIKDIKKAEDSTAASKLYD